MSGMMSAPKFVKTLPATARPPRSQSGGELAKAVQAFVEKLHNHRDEYALAVVDVVTTSTYYEAFRKAGCEVRVVIKTNLDGSPKVERRKNRAGQEKDYPVCDIYVLLPEGPIQNLSNRKPWVDPKKRLDNLHQQVQANRANDADPSAQVAEIAKILERNEKLRTSHPVGKIYWPAIERERAAATA